MKKKKIIFFVKNRTELESAEKMIQDLVNEAKITKEEIYERYIYFSTAEEEWNIYIYKTAVGLCADKVYYSNSLTERIDEFKTIAKEKNEPICIEF